MVLKPGDKLVSVDGRGGSEIALRNQIATHKCAGAPVNGCLAATPVRIVLRRAGQLVTVNVRPRYVASARRMEVGFVFGSTATYPGPVSAAGTSVSALASTSARLVSTVVRIFEPQVRRQLHSVVGGYETTQQSFAQSTSQAFYVLALISLSLGIVNLFPFLPLDGGHIFWAVAEKVRGRRISFAVMERAGIVGFVLIIMIFFIGLSNDISQISSGIPFAPR
jgi:regulator of sigma E protease